MKGIPPKIGQHQIELDTSMPLVYQTRYQLNPNYAIIVKQDINKVLATSFIKFVKKVILLSPIILLLKNNGN